MPPINPGVTVIVSDAECPEPPSVIVTAAAPDPSITIVNLCPVPEPLDEPPTSL